MQSDQIIKLGRWKFSVCWVWYTVCCFYTFFHFFSLFSSLLRHSVEKSQLRVINLSFKMSFLVDLTEFSEAGLLPPIGLSLVSVFFLFFSWVGVGEIFPIVLCFLLRVENNKRTEKWRKRTKNWFSLWGLWKKQNILMGSRWRRRWKLNMTYIIWFQWIENFLKRLFLLMINWNQDSSHMQDIQRYFFICAHIG